MTATHFFRMGFRGSKELNLPDVLFVPINGTQVILAGSRKPFVREADRRTRLGKHGDVIEAVPKTPVSVAPPPTAETHTSLSARSPK